MPNQPIVFNSGHSLHDNGVGDYNFFCPEKVKALFFMPYMIARCTPWGRRRAYCPYCNKSIGSPLEELHA